MHREELNALEGIAIVGMACRFPGAADPGQFWENLCQAKEGISFFQKDELLEAGVSPRLLEHPHFVAAKGALPDAHLFDAAFFGINPGEAVVMDPQHRLFLECAWEAFEGAGYVPASMTGSVGVFSGAGLSYYLLLNLLANEEALTTAGVYQVMLANDKDFIPTRVAYKLNLRGPALNVSTACSSSLVAVHMACSSLLSYQCDAALAGGAAVQSPLIGGYVYESEGIASPDGHCRSFDALAQGTVLSSGVGCVLLKRLADAYAAGDHIYAVIKGSAVNNDGSNKVGFTAPSRDGQAEVISEALALAEVDASTVGYVEAHGTATLLGDPIEVSALTRAFRGHTPNKGYCGIGSVKSNLGHLDAAAGIAGLIKAALAIYYGEIPPTLYCNTPNPKIPWMESPFFPVTQRIAWPLTVGPRRAGVSSFGIGGTNAHVVLQQAPDPKPRQTAGPYQILPISARNEKALAATAERLGRFLSDGTPLADVAYTLALGRTHFPVRGVVVSDNTNRAGEVLTSGAFAVGMAEPNASFAFVFPGQGTRYRNVLPSLYRGEPCFAKHLDECSRLLMDLRGVDLMALLFPEDESTLETTLEAQPSIFAIEYALGQCLIGWGIDPKAMIGHSIGELVAACIAGVFSLEDALELVCARAEAMSSMPPGAMLALTLPADDAAEYLFGDLDLAAVNGPRQVVISGPSDQINTLVEELRKSDIPSTLLKTSHAFHGRMMAPASEDFLDAFECVSLYPPKIPVISNVTGTWLIDSQATSPQYWARQIRATVLFEQGCTTLLTEGSHLPVEVGPGKVLTGLLRSHPDLGGRAVLPLLETRGRIDDCAAFCHGLGQLWAHGAELDWAAYYQGRERCRLALPTYPFQRESYWVNPIPAQDKAEPKASVFVENADNRAKLEDWFFQPGWQTTAHPVSAQTEARCLLVMPTAMSVAPLAARLKDLGHAVTVVVLGSEFRRVDEDSYALDPKDPLCWRRLWAELDQMGHLPQVIAYGLALHARQQDDEVFLEQTIGGLLGLIQELGRAGLAQDRRLLVIVDQLHPITGGEPLHIIQAALSGIVRVAPHEFPNLCCRMVDLVWFEDGTASKAMVTTLAAEILVPSDHVVYPADLIVAYRGNRRYRQIYTPQPINPALASPLKKGGVYAIAGGLGGMGLAIAGYLAKNFQANLILLGRADFPDPSLWDQWLAIQKEHTRAGKQDPVSRKIQSIRALEGLGARVMLISADISDRTALYRALDQGRNSLGPIDGIFHCAGLAGGGLLELMSVDGFRKTLVPKWLGTENIACYAREQALDFVCFASSLAAFFGPFGQADYVAANAVMDLSAHLLRNQGVPALTLNWDTWKEAGMATRAASEELARMLEQSHAHGIANEEGCRILEWALTADLVQLGVSTHPFLPRLESDFQRKNTEETQLKTGPRHPRPARLGGYTPPRNEIESGVADIWKEALGFQEIGVTDSFFDLDGNSLVGVAVINRINRTFSCNLSVVHLYEGLTVAFIADLVAKGGAS